MGRVLFHVGQTGMWRGADAVIMRGVVPSGGDWTVWSGVTG